MTSKPQDLIFGHFVLLVPFEILSCYPNINGSLWLRREIQWNIAKIVREKLSPRTFLREFSVFACICFFS